MILVHDDHYIFVCVQYLKTVANFFNPRDILKYVQNIEPIASGKYTENMQNVLLSVRRMRHINK